MAKDDVPAAIRDPVERFERDAAAFRSPQYKEEQLRLEFLNPLFEALGWDVQNRQGRLPFSSAYANKGGRS